MPTHDRWRDMTLTRWALHQAGFAGPSRTAGSGCAWVTSVTSSATPSSWHAAWTPSPVGRGYVEHPTDQGFTRANVHR